MLVGCGRQGMGFKSPGGSFTYIYIYIYINGFSLEREGGIHFLGASEDQPPSLVSRHHNFGQKLRTDGYIYVKFN